MSIFECPYCAKEYDIGEYPDHLFVMNNNRFEFECDCGAEFECEVEWEPIIWPILSSLKRTKPRK